MAFDKALVSFYPYLVSLYDIVFLCGTINHPACLRKFTAQKYSSGLVIIIWFHINIWDEKFLQIQTKCDLKSIWGGTFQSIVLSFEDFLFDMVALKEKQKIYLTLLITQFPFSLNTNTATVIWILKTTNTKVNQFIFE